MNDISNMPARSDAQTERFLGLLATIAESWRLIFLVPLVVAALALAFLGSRPRYYESDAILRLAPDEVVVLKSSRVFGAEVGKVIEADSTEHAKSLSLNVSTLASPELYNIAIIWDSATGAAGFLQGMIDRLVVESKPLEIDRVKLENRLKVLKQSQSSLTQSLEKVNKIYDRIAQSDLPGGASGFDGNIGQSFAILIAAITAGDQDITNVETLLRGSFLASDVVQPPTVATEAMPRNIAPFVMLAFVLSFAILLAFALARGTVRGASDSPNLTRIRRTLRRRPNS